MAFQAVQYKNDDLIHRKLNPEPRALRWTLRQQCIEPVKRRILQWARNQNEPPPYQFSSCPSALLQEVLQSVLIDESGSAPLKRVVEQFLANGLEGFDLACVDDLAYREAEPILQLMRAHGRNLRRLRLVGPCTLSRSASPMIHRVLRSCPNLAQLALQQAGHEEVICVARHCPQLRRLEVLHPSLSDQDVALVQAAARAENLPAAESLKSLLVPSLLSGGALLTLLEVFPEVVDLTCVDLEGLMSAMAEAPPPTATRGARLQALRINRVMGWKSVENLVQAFPGLRSLSLEIQEIMNLQVLSQLPDLAHLRVANSHVIPSSYADDVLPLLKAIGRNLKHLGLAHFDVIELPKTHAYCPNLTSLELQHFTLLGCNCDPLHQLQYGRQKPFANVRHLAMRPRQGRSISQEACHFLLKHSRQLRRVELHEAYGLTDALATVLSDLNGFCDLRRICLRGGHSLSRSGIETLLRKSTQLRHCHIP